MATYSELRSLRDNAALLEKVEVACWIEGDAIRIEDPATLNHAERLAWAARMYADPRNEAYRMLPQLLAQNKAASVTAITDATDALVQFNVSKSVNLFAISDATP